jgi:hypothetical protein
VARRGSWATASGGHQFVVGLVCGSSGILIIIISADSRNESLRPVLSRVGRVSVECVMALLTDGLWCKRLYLELGNLGEFRVVGSTREAVNIPINRWSVKSGDALRNGISICSAVLDGEESPDEGTPSFWQSRNPVASLRINCRRT